MERRETMHGSLPGCEAAGGGSLLVESHFASPEECGRFGRFLAWLAGMGRSEATARAYRSDWQDLACWFRRARGRPFSAEALDAAVIGDWREAGRARGKSAATLTRRVAFARTYGRWLAEAGVVEGGEEIAAMSGANPDAGDRGPRILADPEVHRLLRQVDERGCRRDQAILYVLLDTGVRVGELVELDVGCVDFATGLLRVGQVRPRELPLPTRSARKLAWSLAERGLLEVPPDGEIVLPATGGWPPSTRVGPPDPARLPSVATLPVSPMPLGVSGAPAGWPLFVGERGRLTQSAVQRIVRKHAAFARIDASPHVLRHTFAFGYWARTRDLVALAEHLGHETPETARIYAQLTRALEEQASVSAERVSA